MFLLCYFLNIMALTPWKNLQFHFIVFPYWKCFLWLYKSACHCSYGLIFFVMCCAMLHSSTLCWGSVTVQSQRCHLNLCLYMSSPISSLSHTFSLLNLHCALLSKLYASEGGRSFSHQSSSDWQFNLIHRFNLLCITSNNTDNAHKCPCTYTFVSLCVYVSGTCVCLHPLVSLKLPLRAFVLLHANPPVSLLSAMSRTVSSKELKGFCSLHWYSALKDNFSVKLVLCEITGNQSRHGSIHCWANKVIGFF